MGLKASTTPQSATTNWSTKLAGSVNTWATGYLAAAPNVFNPANIKDANWQAGVSDPNAAVRYKKGMSNVNMSQLTAVVNAGGKQKLASSATTKQAKMASFMATFLGKLDSITRTLDTSSPRGPRGSQQNRARLNNYLDAVAATRGQNT